MSAYTTNGSGGETEKINTNIVTLTRFLTEEQAKHKEATGDFTYVHPAPNPSQSTL
jgi:fructose-1,6-bisphosphatase I